jgi:Ni/Fe-hydrogenase subunit HybB-like protein
VSAWTRGGCGGCLAGTIISVLGILGAGSASAGMYGTFLVAPVMLVLAIPLGAGLGLTVGRLLSHRRESRWLGGSIGLVLGAAIGLAFDVANQGEVDLQTGLLLITTWIGVWAGAFAAAPIWSRKMRRWAGWQPRRRPDPPDTIG